MSTTQLLIINYNKIKQQKKGKGKERKGKKVITNGQEGN
jgi:hypothetical protein